MKELIVKEHPMRLVVLEALRMSRSLDENSPAAMARATKAVMEARQGMTLGEAFSIVWNIWEL
ncbi:MAG: hypothetical protein Q7R40_02910 [Phaeospirillum sp.]|nr:hypothetical protein [Phaeospirillum sp.]